MTCMAQVNSCAEDLAHNKFAVESGKEQPITIKGDEINAKKHFVGFKDSGNKDSNTLAENDEKRKQLLEVNRLKARERRKRQKVQQEQEQQYILKVSRDNDELKIENDELRRQLDQCQRQLLQQQQILIAAEQSAITPKPTLHVLPFQTDRSVIESLLVGGLRQNRSVGSARGIQSVPHSFLSHQSSMASVQELLREMTSSKSRRVKQHLTQTPLNGQIGGKRDEMNMERSTQLANHQLASRKRSIVHCRI